MTPVTMPQVGENLTSGVVLEWMKAEGESVARGEILAIVESEKAAFEVAAETDGVLLKVLVAAGQEADVLSVIACIGEEGETIEMESLRPTTTTTTTASAPAQKTRSRSAGTQTRPPEAVRPGLTVSGATTLSDRPFASPSARRLARELLVELSGIRGSGPAGRVIRRDILAAALHASGGAPAIEPAATPVPEPGDRLQPNTRLRQTIADRMSASARQIPHFYLFADVDVTSAMHRQQELKSEGIGLTDMVVYACARSLRQFERLNAHVGDRGIVCKANVHIGLAVAIDDGLLVPPLPHADRVGLRTLAQMRRTTVDRARTGLVDPEPATTFTISNLGPLGVTRFLPLINPPECAILGVGCTQQGVVAQGGKPMVRDMMTLSLACDHRAVDGAYAAAFLAQLKQMLQSPRDCLDLSSTGESGGESAVNDGCTGND